MVEAHMTGLTGFGLSRFSNRKCVTGMAGIAGATPIFLSGELQVDYFFFRLEANLVTTTAPFLSRRHAWGLHVKRGHCLHDRPCESMLAFRKLLDAIVMAFPACIRSWKEGVVRIVCCHVFAAMTVRTADTFLKMLARPPVANDSRRRLGVTVYAGFIGHRGRRPHSWIPRSNCNQE
jgi:hypothetical protein